MRLFNDGRPGPVLAAGCLAVMFAAFGVGSASAAISAPPVAGHNITVFPDRDFVHVDGYAAGQSLTVNVVRNGTVIGTATGAADAAGVLEINHPGGTCWTTVTPDILPGDVVQALTDPAVPTGDATTTANVAVTDGPVADAAGHVIVRGTAQDAAGAPLPVGQLEQRMVNGAGFAGTQHKRDARAPGDGTLSYDAPGSIHWTATYAFSAADTATALDPATMTRVLWRGVNPVLLNELTISEFATAGGPVPGCNAPLATTAMTTISRTVVNAANAGQDITVGGPAQGGPAGVSAVSVSLPESAGSTPVAATLSAPGPAGQMTWTATIPAAMLADAVLPQGDFHLVATYTGPGAPPAETRGLHKDTIAPPAPNATPAPGVYATAQSVALSSPEVGGDVHYTVDGNDPAPTSAAFAQAVPVTSAQTIKAIAVDAAGNASPAASFAYTISAPQPTTILQSIAATALDTTALRIGGLRTHKHLSRRQARRAGIRITFTAPHGTGFVQVRLYRTTRSHRAGHEISRTLVNATGAQQHAILRAPRLTPGVYVLELRPAVSATQLGQATTTRLRITP